MKSRSILSIFSLVLMSLLILGQPAHAREAEKTMKNKVGKAEAPKLKPAEANKVTIHQSEPAKCFVAVTHSHQPTPVSPMRKVGARQGANHPAHANICRKNDTRPAAPPAPRHPSAPKAPTCHKPIVVKPACPTTPPKPIGPKHEPRKHACRPHEEKQPKVCHRHEPKPCEQPKPEPTPAPVQPVTELVCSDEQVYSVGENHVPFVGVTLEQDLSDNAKIRIDANVPFGMEFVETDSRVVNVDKVRAITGATCELKVAKNLALVTNATAYVGKDRTRADYSLGLTAEVTKNIALTVAQHTGDLDRTLTVGAAVNF